MNRVLKLSASMTKGCFMTVEKRKWWPYAGFDLVTSSCLSKNIVEEIWL